MSTKYYRVKKPTFMWDEGAIVESSGNGYRALDELHHHVYLGSEYISDHIVENPGNADFFERVYKVDLVTRTVYELKDKAKELLANNFKKNE